MAVTLGAEVLAPFRRFSLYNSPYVAHDDGSAVDLYPPADADSVPSPVAGEVLDTRTVRAPPQPYAEPADHLVLVDAGEYVARLMHVDPAVEPGDVLARGDDLGRPVRAGFFAPWVPNHLHLEFRSHDVDPYRASGSVRLDVDVEVRGLSWDGTGIVVESGETWARLDSPAHPSPNTGFAGLAVDVDGRGHGAGVVDRRGVLDGGFPHYDGGGVLWSGDGRGSGGSAGGSGSGGGSGGADHGSGDRAVRLARHRVGVLDGRDVAWADREVLANGDPVRGIACYADRAEPGVKLVGPSVDLAVGEPVAVEVRDVA